MDIDVTKEITEEQISVEMNKNTQGFDENYPLGFMSPGGFVRFQVTELSANGTPRYAYPKEGCNYALSLFGKEYNEGKTWGTDHSDWIPLNTKKELVLALQIQKDKRYFMDRLGKKKLADSRSILNEFLSPEQQNVLSPSIIASIINAMERVSDDTLKLNK